jgi:hypothetical protein
MTPATPKKERNMNIIAISRGTRFSPNHVDNDAAIYNKVIEELLRMGHSVCSYSEDEFVEASLEGLPELVVTMARDKQTLAILMDWEAKGVCIINSPQGIQNCVRRPMTELLLAHSVPHPRSWIVATDGPLPKELTFPCWFKRGDSHVVVKQDVCYVSSYEEAIRVVTDMRDRDIPSVVINEHVEGDLVKFYGVQGDDFFHWFYPSAHSHSKFGLEAINGLPQGLSFDPAQLKQYADEAARVLDVPIYGGDAVVMADGSLWIIDFNDWPSFAPCREEAARAIARRVKGSDPIPTFPKGKE